VALASPAYGYPIADAIAGFCIAVIIPFIGMATAKEAGLVLADACDAECITKGKDIRTMVSDMDGVHATHSIRLRRTGPYPHGELEIVVNAQAAMREVDALRQTIQQATRARYLT
jgi:divalent metal cation (Fe/Co/Zn/Cd) transporter